MQVSILDLPKLIELNNLQEVKSSRLFNTKMTFDPDGILSNELFGLSKSDRRNTFAYINLHVKFIHPHLYKKVLGALYKNAIKYIVSGKKRYVVRDGLLAEDPNGWTGLPSLYDHWNEIRWEKHPSSNKLNKELMEKLERKDVFIDQVIVIPPAFRDVMLAGSMDSSDHVGELNKIYQQIIGLVSNLNSGGLFTRTQYSTHSKIEDLLVSLYDYFKNLIARKEGLIKRNLLGKSVDFGSRAVISSAQYNVNRLDDMMVDLEHSALPISSCCSNFYPLIEAWLKNFFQREIISDPNQIAFWDPVAGREVTARLKDPDIQFSDKNIRKLINDYCMNPANRFATISVMAEVQTSSGTKELKVVLVFKGKEITSNNTSKVLNRALTITDVLYMACVDCCESRHLMISRYPVGTDKGIFFSKIRVQSTSEHCRVIFNGKEYPFYPVIDLDADPHKVEMSFIDTLVMSNSHLDGMGADFDGDVLSVRGIWSDEANLEAEEIMSKKISALDISGKNTKVVSKEVVNSMFELTKIDPSGKTLSKEECKVFLNTPATEITLSKLTHWFADTVDNSTGKKTGKRKAKYNTFDRIDIPAGYFYDGQKELNTTVGRFIANKFMLEQSGVISVTYFVDDVLGKKGLGKLDDEIAYLYMTDKIDRPQFNKYVDARDCIGYWLNGMLAHTISDRMLKPLPEIEKKKAELFKKYEKEIAAGDIDVMTRVSNDLIAYAKEILKGDPGMDLYDSGDLDFSNNYRNNAILRGAVMNKITDKFDFVGTSLMGGIEVKDIPVHANSILSSQFPASIATASSGYLGKQIAAMLQMTSVDVEGSDCGTKNLIPIDITKYNKDKMMYTYIDNGSGQLILLEGHNIDQYVGKKVRMRSPMSCKNEKICSICAGKLFHYLGVEHAGLFGIQISYSALNLALKAKHCSVVDIFTMDPDSIIEEIED